MALGDILAAIRSETEVEIARIRSDGEARIAALLERATSEAAAAEEEAASAMDAAAAHRRDQIVNRARLEAERMVRRAVEEVYVDTVEAAEGRIGALRAGDGYEALLGDLLEECLAVLPDARVVEVDPADEALVDRLLADRGIHHMRVDPCLTTAGGVALSTRDGRRVINTFESRRARAERHLRRIAIETIPAIGRAAP